MTSEALITMNNEWQEFLIGNGAILSADGCVDFSGDNELAGQNSVCDLSGDCVLRVTGEDADAFLQGQFSNDLLALGIPGSHLNTWSSPKGRVLTLFRLVRDNDGYLLKLPRDLVEPIQKRLKMFVLRAKVNIDQMTDSVCLGVSGNGVAAVLGNTFQNVPAALDETTQLDSMTVYRVRGDDRFEIIAPQQDARKLWQQLSEVCQPAGETVWRLQNIDAGVPHIGQSTTEAFVLQMLNLHHINGVSFKKGCFPGQEVVARMQYLGKLKRRMYRAQATTAEGAQLPLPGAEVFNKDVASAVGKIVDAQMVGDGSFRMLLVNAIAAADKPLYLDAQATQPIDLLELPYNLDEE